ncbi:hypothetical protein VN24_01860 [Paenibacillus beijingensis]|uniref:Uncharacterized protein n=2 Tax=Paenibacillus beijingensis TaxID=1126833 RepID=A0A0D5NQ37_9BACL|nr:hypothetical protein VN24_01860 [Paenibacillus beijingensis]
MILSFDERTRYSLEEREAKLLLIAAIARSQQALARLLENAADAAEQLPGMPGKLREHIRLLTGIQMSMAESVTGMALRSRKRSAKPSPPWMNPSVRLERRGGDGHGIHQKRQRDKKA